MADDGLKYDVMVERALRGVLREALTYIAENGLPGDHHIYITFRTDHPDVDIPDALHDRYPGEMTIVLQHQFWDLEVGKDLFGVTLSFADVPHRLGVPFESVIAFADPSVRFGLQFDSGPASEEAAEARPSAEIETLPIGSAAQRDDEPRPTDAPAAKAAGSDGKSTAKTGAESGKAQRNVPSPEPPDDGAGEIIPLDSFRKK